MKKIILSLALSLLGFNLIGQTNTVKVDSYYKADGTYVKEHYRTAPNSTINDNWSTSPNVNPYTGEKGTKQPEYNIYTTPTPTYYYNEPKTTKSKKSDF